MAKLLMLFLQHIDHRILLELGCMGIREILYLITFQVLTEYTWQWTILWDNEGYQQS